jgi:hypothetical protein
MTHLGFQVVLVRDLTDAMYDPRTRPFVSHTRGTELVIEHIESRWCPSIMRADLTRVIAGTDSPRECRLGNRMIISGMELRLYSRPWMWRVE